MCSARTHLCGQVIRASCFFGTMYSHRCVSNFALCRTLQLRLVHLICAVASARCNGTNHTKSIHARKCNRVLSAANCRLLIIFSFAGHSLTILPCSCARLCSIPDHFHGLELDAVHLCGYYVLCRLTHNRPAHLYSGKAMRVLIFASFKAYAILKPSHLKLWRNSKESMRVFNLPRYGPN